MVSIWLLTNAEVDFKTCICLSAVLELRIFVSHLQLLCFFLLDCDNCSYNASVGRYHQWDPEDDFVRNQSRKFI